jgi:hypothetical protein
MQKLKVGFKQSGFIYDFNKDGGAKDVPIKTGLIFPVGVIISNMRFNFLIALTSPGAGTIQFKLDTQDIPTTQILINPNIGTINLNGTTNNSSPLFLTPKVSELIITPLVFDITGGSFAFFFNYIQVKL